jgi:hypothetical protein
MAFLYITEYETLTPTTEGGAAQAARTPPVVDQPPVAIGAASLQSAIFGPTTKYVRLHTDAICSIAFGPNPTATMNNQRLAADQTEYFGVTPGSTVAVIANT